MAPSTRSGSRQNTPASSPRAATNTTTPSRTSTTETPSKKVPKCRTCGEPMKGHSKEKCLETARTKEEAQSSRQSEEVQPPTGAMRSMRLGSSDRMQDQGEEDKKFIRARRRKSVHAAAMVPSDTVHSLSSSANDVVDRLREPGIMNDNPATIKVRDWEEAIVKSPLKKTRPRQYMPCTLVPPTPDGSFAVRGDGVVPKEESPSVSVKPPPSEEESLSTASKTARPLARSMSQEERDLFMDALRGEAKAQAYYVAKEDIPKLQENARKLRISARSLVPSNEQNAVFVVADNEANVREVARKIEEESKGSQKITKGRTSGAKMVAVAGGVIAGAIGTWAGLAYS